MRCITLAHSLRIMASTPNYILAHLVFFKITTKWIWTFSGGTCLSDTKINIKFLKLMILNCNLTSDPEN